MKRRTLRCFLFPVLAGLLNGSCGDSGKSESGASYEFPVVGNLNSSRYQVILHTAPDGPRYTLLGDVSEGAVLLAQEMTASEFRERYPLIHDDVRRLWAGTGSPRDSFGRIPVELPTKGIRNRPGSERVNSLPIPPLRNGH
ncbi:MAG: hypothetical protein MI807_21270 [Verrucomicrobiales bacterium]|nr:hypothetical protein [Verrucomicrobiales bacterium]